MKPIEATTIRDLFSNSRPIDRPIEKVIDYYATTDAQLQAEIEEYEVTPNVEQSFRRFIEHFGEGVRGNRVVQVGVWVSGFYGSGKSSFTKYLGFALDPNRKVGGRPFLDLLAERINADDVVAELRTLAANYPVAVIMLDLGAEQLANASNAPVSTVLYWKVLQWAGFSKEEKLATLELRLDREGRLEEFRRAYAERFGQNWQEIHNDPLVGIGGAAQIVSQFFPQEFPDAKSFRELRFTLAGDVRARASEILDLVQRKTGRNNVLFLIDEVGQYVAPRSELILNLDGFVRSFKEIGSGRAWVVATAQQTLAEIVERVAYNSDELNRLRDRFPINLELDATDIREITARRLLTKSASGEETLRDLFRRSGASLVAHTRIDGAALYRSGVDEETFRRLYPFLPQHFDVLLSLVRALAGSSGGIGLRSAIRVIQDVLVDTSKVLLPGSTVLADCPVGRLATVDQFFDTLRVDIGKAFPHVVAGVDRASRILPGDDIASRVAKAVAALQPIEKLPRTTENLAALLYAQIGDVPNLEEVRAALRRLLDAGEIGLVDDRETGGYAFLSEAVKPLRGKRNAYRPTTAELSGLRSRLLVGLFDGAPTASLEGAKTVKAAVALDRAPIIGDGGDATFRLLFTDGASWERRRLELVTETTGHAEWRAAIAWLASPDDSVEDFLNEIARSRWIVHATPEAEADRDVAQFLRSERQSIDSRERAVATLYRRALLDGLLIFRGAPTAAGVAGVTIDEAARTGLAGAAAAIFSSFHLTRIHPPADQAVKFLSVERPERMTAVADPLQFVTVVLGRARVDPNHATLVETLRAVRAETTAKGTPRIPGNTLQDLFAAPPYGWSKDATRYVFAALLVAGEVVVHTAGSDLKTVVPEAIRSFSTSTEFNRVAISIRDSRPSPEALDRAATRLESLFGVTVLPLESELGTIVRRHLPERLATIASLTTQLVLLELPGLERAQFVDSIGQSLVRGDGAVAVATLGGVDCAFPDDLRWAEAAARALAGGAAADIRSTRAVLAEAEDLIRLFPAEARGLLLESECDTVRDVLTSEGFYLRLADLRGVTGAVRNRALDKFRIQRADYGAELADARHRLESHPDWLKLTDEDRAELARRLEPGIGDSPALDRAIASLSQVIARRLGLSNLEASVQAELTRRVPPPSTGDSPPDLPPAETIVDLADLLPLAPLEDLADLKNWLRSVQAQLELALRDGHPIRLQVSR